MVDYLSSFVYLTNVAANDHQGNIYKTFRRHQCADIKIKANADIWSLDGNKLVATWENSDGTTTPVYFCLYGAGNSIVLTGDPAGCNKVVRSISTFDRATLANLVFRNSTSIIKLHVDTTLKVVWTMLWTMLDNVSLVTASYRLRSCVAPIPSFFEQSM